MIASDKMRDVVLFAAGAGAVASLAWLSARALKKSRSRAESISNIHGDLGALIDAIKKRDESVLAYADIVEEKTRRMLMERGSKKIAPSFMVLKMNLSDGDHQHVKQHIDNISGELESMGIPTRL